MKIRVVGQHLRSIRSTTRRLDDVNGSTVAEATEADVAVVRLPHDVAPLEGLRKKSLPESTNGEKNDP
jgi:hypothetical protein